MTNIRLTKNELRLQQLKLNQLETYLPTLQLKKSMLQTQVAQAKLEIDALQNAFEKKRLDVSEFAALLTEVGIPNLDQVCTVDEIQTSSENIAGVEVPVFEKLELKPFEYSLFDTPAWLDSAFDLLKIMMNAKGKVLIAFQRKHALEKELRDVSIRVNLFEKNLIPKAKASIKKIKIFLGDQELAEIGRAKVAKNKILKKKLATMET